MTHLQPPSRRNCDLVHKWADTYVLPFLISTAGTSTTQNKPAVPVKCFKSLWGLCLITGETPAGWRWMLLKEKGVGSSHVRGGRGVLITQTQNFPEVMLEILAEAVCATYAFRICELDFTATGTIAKPWSLQDPQKAIASRLISSRIYMKVGWMVQQQTERPSSHHYRQ